jgi:hypothetical protein
MTLSLIGLKPSSADRVKTGQVIGFLFAMMMFSSLSGKLDL